TAQFPLSFEVNHGQAAAGTKFVARGGGYTLLLTDRGEPVLALSGQPLQTDKSHAGKRAASLELGFPDLTERAVLRLEFAGSNAAPHAEGERLLPGRSNYLIGNDPEKWLTAVAHYEQVRYREVYSGVDVLYYVKDQQLEYDLIVRPGTNPDTIRMAV